MESKRIDRINDIDRILDRIEEYILNKDIIQDDRLYQTAVDYATDLICRLECEQFELETANDSTEVHDYVHAKFAQTGEKVSLKELMEVFGNA